MSRNLERNNLLAFIVFSGIIIVSAAISSVIIEICGASDSFMPRGMLLLCFGIILSIGSIIDMIGEKNKTKYFREIEGNINFQYTYVDGLESFNRAYDYQVNGLKFECPIYDAGVRSQREPAVMVTILYNPFKPGDSIIKGENEALSWLKLSFFLLMSGLVIMVYAYITFYA